MSALAIATPDVDVLPLEETPSLLDPLQRMSKDIKASTLDLTQDEARFVVTNYYNWQQMRINSAAQRRELAKINAKAAEPGEAKPHLMLDYIYTQSRMLEQQILAGLDVHTNDEGIGAWAKTIIGIGPVLSAGLKAHVKLEVELKEKKGKKWVPTGEIKRLTTASSIWKFAGLDPTVKWEKGKARPWNADLKTLCWKIGQSFIKVSGNQASTYGRLYVQFKEAYIEKNKAGGFREYALERAPSYNKKTVSRAAYDKGTLPDAQITARAARAATKIFLAHWHHVLFRMTYGKKPPAPWVIEHGGHAHDILIPNYPWDDQ